MAKRKTRGALFREAMAASYEVVRPDEREMVEEAARLLDLVDELTGAVTSTGFLGTGSTGQPVVNPLLTALQSARAELRQVLRQLNLPEPPGGDDDED
jgi:hypothetical protein